MNRSAKKTIVQQFISQEPIFFLGESGTDLKEIIFKFLRHAN